MKVLLHLGKTPSCKAFEAYGGISTLASTVARVDSFCSIKIIVNIVKREIRLKGPRISLCQIECRCYDVLPILFTTKLSSGSEHFFLLFLSR